MNCHHCKTVAAQHLCGSCNTAAYCSQSCQSAAWQNGHSLECIGNKKRERDARDEYYQFIREKRYAEAAQHAADANLPLITLLQEALSGIRTQLVDELMRYMNEIRSIPLEYCRDPEMVEHLTRMYPLRADVYAFVTDDEERPDTVALERLARFMDIRPFCAEAREETPPRVKLFLERPSYAQVNTPALTLEELRHMTWHGFEFHLSEHWKADVVGRVQDLFFRRKNAETFQFWHGVSVEEFLGRIQFARFYDIEQLRRNTIASPQSFPLMLLDYEAIYVQSRRARTDMRLFKTPDSKTISRAPPIVGLTSIEMDREFVPVTRYAKGMSQSLFFGEDKETEYCGTFYYMERESQTYLYFTRGFQAPNKYKAVKYLIERNGLKKHKFKNLMRSSKTDKRFETDSLLMTPLEYIVYNQGQLYYEYDPQNFGRIDIPESVTLDRRHYTAHLLGYYAKEDSLDQILCDLARQFGYDVVILTNMVGSQQIVTEVLDTRPREESFANLHYLRVGSPTY